MNCLACTRGLDDFVDGELGPTDRAAIEAHLAQCPDCRSRLESLRRLLARTAALPGSIAPQRDLWSGIEAHLATNKSSRNRPLLRWSMPLGLAAAIATLATVAERTVTRREHRPAWLVATVTGAPRVDAETVGRETNFRVGQWLETDETSRARVSVGRIGEVTVDPNSRLRLVGTAARDHRLELKRGTLNAVIWAPPRLFFVDTPSATAVDLGCAYTLTVDDDGNGELLVSAGYVALEHGGRESIIPWGMKCLTRRGAGPGTPFAANAPDALRQALTRFDFEPAAAPTALAEILTLVRPDDAVTLWHLLTRTHPAERAAVFEVLAKLAPPPEGITRAGILAGNTVMRRTWATALGLGGFDSR